MVEILKDQLTGTEPQLIALDDTPTQTASLNCGIYVCLFFKNLIKNDSTIQFKSANETRREVMKIIESNIEKYVPEVTLEYHDKKIDDQKAFRYYDGLKDEQIKNIMTHEKYCDTFKYLN